MNRHGSALVLALAILAAVGIVAAAEASAYVIRLHGLRDRAVRLQAVELARSAAILPDGSSVIVGEWRVSRGGDVCVATGPSGSATVSSGSQRFQRIRP